MKAKLLLQTRVDAKLGKWVEREAAKAGLSVAAWLRVLVIQRRTVSREKR